MQNRLQVLTETLSQYDKQQVSIQTLFEQIGAVFLQFKDEALLLKSDQKEVWLKNVQDTLHKLCDMLQPYLESVSISDEQLILILDDPSFFDPTDWSEAQKTKTEIQDSLRTLIPLFFEKPIIENSADDSSIEKKKKPPRPPSKSDWMKS